MINLDKLTFTRAKNNTKLRLLGLDRVWSIALPGGTTCPAARLCRAWADHRNGKITDDPMAEVRCFAVSMESVWKSYREMVWRNYRLLLATDKNAGGGDAGTQAMTGLILHSLPKKFNAVRIHVGGDFYNERYFKAWIDVANVHTDKIFYFYTKMIPFLIKYEAAMPDNFRGVASVGGVFDKLAYGWRSYSKIVYSEQEAADLGLPIDHDDSHAVAASEPFALLIHGVQKAGSPASKAVAAIKAALKAKLGGV